MSAARILIVDDEPDMLENCSRILSRQGYACLTAENGHAALAILEREHPDLLLTDLKMPEMDGMALLHHAHEMDPALPVFELQTLDAGLAQRADKQRAVSSLVAAFGLLALLLAAVGLYGVMAYTVTRRRREIGVRLALGATPSQLTRLVAIDGLRLAAIGVGIGTVLALPVARALGTLVFGVGIVDAAGFAGASALLIVVALAAAALPARRAARLDPIDALRVE